jgi:hypothetical protein
MLHSVRLVQTELGRLENGLQVGQNGDFVAAETLKINSLARAAGVDIAGVASSILATPTIFSFFDDASTTFAGRSGRFSRGEVADAKPRG